MMLSLSRVQVLHAVLSIVCITVTIPFIAHGDGPEPDEYFQYFTSTAKSAEVLRLAVSKPFSIFVSTNAQYSIEKISDRRRYQIHPKTELYNNILTQIQASSFLRNGETNQLKAIPFANHLFFNANLRSFQCNEQFVWDWMDRKKSKELNSFLKDMNNMIESYDDVRQLPLKKTIVIPRHKSMPVSTFCPEIIPNGKAVNLGFDNKDIFKHNLLIAISPFEMPDNVIVEVNDGRKWRPCDLSSQHCETIKPGRNLWVKILVLPNPKDPDSRQSTIPVLLKVE